MRFRAACLLLLLLVGTMAQAQTPTVPQRPFGQIVDVWTRQLDRIADRATQPGVLAGEIDALREEVTDVRLAASAAAQLARSNLADIRRLLVPLEVKPGPDRPAETDEVRAERQRLTEQAAISEGRVKQSEVVIARANQLLEHMTRLRGQVVLNILLRRDASPLSGEVLRNVGTEFAASMQGLMSAFSKWAREGPRALRDGARDLTGLAAWAALTVVLWWLGRTLARRFGRGHHNEPGQRDRTIAAAIDGLGLVLVPILAVWLIGRLLVATDPPQPLAMLLPELVLRLIVLLLVLGMTTTALAPDRPAWRVLPLTDPAARLLAQALRRLIVVGTALDFLYLALVQDGQYPALSSLSALVLAGSLAFLALPVLGNAAWQASRPEGSDRPFLVGGTLWTATRVGLRAVLLSSIAFALLGYVVLATHIHTALAWTCLLVALALTAHRLAGDLLETMAAPDTPTGAWVRRLFGLPADITLRGQHIALLLIDVALVVALALTIPAAWNVDTDAILRGMAQVVMGVKIGGVTISLRDIALSLITFAVCMLLVRLVRRIVRDRVMPTVDASLPMRQSVDAGLNYAGVAIALLVAIGALGIDFTNLAIVLGALSVGIGLGLQNIANNIISGVLLLVERSIKAGDWISVSGHEGFVRRINIRATEIETFQRTHVIVPNSVFLQNPVVNRTYSDTSSRIDLPITVALATDPAKMEAILRDCALGHPRVLRVPAPIVRFVRVTPTGLEFELYVFVARLEDRIVVTNDLNRAILARMIEEKIVNPTPPPPEYRVRDLDRIAEALRTDRAAAPPR
ncbi:MAG: mechanosensitive ion channel family protein [Enhydrobacter sp.]|nr:MAG: mechanosensitive ion channel family protein [Enhydrobacter sp.]